MNRDFFGALPSEQSALCREIKIVGQPVELAQHKISIGYHKGEKLYIVRTGAGIINAAMITQALLTRYRIDRAISIGVAGNLNDEWRVGDLLVVTNVVNHQEGKETPAGFESKSMAEKTEARIRKSEVYWTKCGELQSNAVAIAKEALERTQAGTPAPPAQTNLVGQASRLPSEKNDGKRGRSPCNYPPRPSRFGGQFHREHGEADLVA